MNEKEYQAKRADAIARARKVLGIEERDIRTQYHRGFAVVVDNLGGRWTGIACTRIALDGADARFTATVTDPDEMPQDLIRQIDARFAVDPDFLYRLLKEHRRKSFAVYDCEAPNLRPPRYYKSDRCRSCGSPVASAVDFECSKCGGLVCSHCGACFCLGS